MRIFNENKTVELTEVDNKKGYLKEEKLFVAHHEAIPFSKGRTVQQIVEELKVQGVGIEIGYGNKPYRIIKEYENGGFDTEAIEDEPDIEAKEAYDEYEDILVYVPYTPDELKERELTILRTQRKLLLEAFDKWEKAVLRGREADDYIIMAWYKDLLDLKETAFANIPEKVRYYL